MQAIVESSFLQALTFALLNSVWQMALLWLALMFVLRVFKLSSLQKFNIAFAAQLTGFLLFIYCFTYAYINKTSFAVLYNNHIAYSSQLRVYFNQLMPYISIAYLVMLKLHFVKLMINYKSVQSLRKFNLKRMPAAERIFVQQLTALLSLKRNVQIYISSKIKCPLTIGFFKPVILIPLAAINHLTKEQMEAVIVHELAHIKRYDYLLNLIQFFIDRIFFFNIFSKMIFAVIEQERENACDDFVLQFKYNSFHYAEALLKLGRLQTINAFVMPASGKKENGLFLRIKRLIHGDNKSLHYNNTSLIKCLYAMLIMLPLMFIFFADSNVKQNKSAASHSIITSVQENENVTTEMQPVSQIKAVSEMALAKPVKKLLVKKDNEIAKTNIKINTLNVEPDYLVNVKQPLDSLKQLNYNEALNKQFILNDDAYKKAMSYQNFQQLEAMLYASGNSISITEDPKTKNSYKKLITIETTDAKGNKNIYKVIVELYQ